MVIREDFEGELRMANVGMLGRGETCRSGDPCKISTKQGREINTKFETNSIPETKMCAQKTSCSMAAHGVCARRSMFCHSF